MLEKAMRLCEAAFGALVINEGNDRVRPVALRGFPSARVDYWGNEPVYLGPETPPYRLVCGERFVHLPDAAEDEGYRSGNPHWRALVEDDGVRTWLAVPLRKDGILVGILYTFRQEVRAFTDKQIALLQNFAAQAVIAMENARLLTETREALAQQTATAEVLQVINSSPGDLAPVFDAILEKARSLCGAPLGALFLADQDSFSAVAMCGGTEAWHDRGRRGFRGDDLPAVGPLLTGEPFVHIADFAEVDNPVARAAVEAVGMRTILTVPLRKDVFCSVILALADRKYVRSRISRSHCSRISRGRL